MPYIWAMYDRAVLHLDLDSFFVSVECLRDSSLKGKPLIIGGMGGRGVVASCSYEARRYGVHSAMPMKMALRLCPHALVLRGDMDAYTRHSALVSEIIDSEAPVFEKSSIDEFYLDLTGMDRYFGCFKWSAELRERIIKESGLPISCALSVNKLVSKVGTGEAKPNGMREIPNGEEREFLAPLSTGKIPGIGKETYKKLSFMGVRTIRVLREIPHPLLEREFGKMGQFLWESANAIDRRQVVPYNEQKSMSKERTFGEDTLDMSFIRSLLGAMVDELAFDLRQESRLTSCITVKIRYADFNTYTKQNVSLIQHRRASSLPMRLNCLKRSMKDGSSSASWGSSLAAWSTEIFSSICLTIPKKRSLCCSRSIISGAAGEKEP